MLQDIREVAARELPFERAGDLLVVGLEIEQALLESIEIGEVVGREHLALDDREVDLQLVEPARVDRRVDDAGGGPLPAEPVDAAPATMDGRVVHDPEHSPRTVVGWSRHDLGDEVVEVGDSRPGIATADTLARWTSQAAM